jgi:hypothetical protein
MLRLTGVALVAMLLTTLSASVSAQVMAPGPALPNNLGGIGPGGTKVAPGPAVDDNLLEQEGPGGVPLARGTAVDPSLHTPRHVRRHASRTQHTAARHRFQQSR